MLYVQFEQKPAFVVLPLSFGSISHCGITEPVLTSNSVILGTEAV